MKLELPDVKLSPLIALQYSGWTQVELTKFPAFYLITAEVAK